MGASKYEKSLDNRSAALVSREGRAPRAGQDCKPCMVNGLQLVSRLSNARGAHVSRTAREDERAAQAHAAKWHRTRLRDSNLKASRERHSPKTRMSLDVSKCHTWDIILGGRDQEQETGKTQTNVAQRHLDFCTFPPQAAAARWARSQSCTRLGNCVTRLPPGACNNMTCFHSTVRTAARASAKVTVVLA